MIERGLAYTRFVEFEWDPDKATRNETRHGVSFPEASTVFDDALSVAVPDPDHSVEEARYIIVGTSHRNRLLIVAYTDEANAFASSARAN